jgi:hypothetical protein
MATATKKSVKNTTKTAKNNAKSKAVKDLVNNSKPKSKAKKDVYATEYGQEVLSVNKQLKTYVKSFKGALSVIQACKTDKALKLTRKQIAILNAAKKQDKVYNFLKENTRTSKTGNSSPFYILQTVRKHQAELLKLKK